MQPFKHRLALVFLVSAICRASAQDVSSIIDHIQAEQVNPVATTAAQPVHPSLNDKPSQKKQLPPRKSNNSSVTYFHPKDRLPDNIAGQLLIGDFKVLGASINGHALIVAEDGLFGRSFEVDNLNTGLAPGQSYPNGQEPRLRFTRNDPLVFIERGVLGYYTVRTTRAIQISQSPAYGGGGGGYYNQGMNGQPYTTPTYRAGWGVSPN